jgi:RNA polymerase sigma-70 factor (ECF subfamily)
VQDEDLVASLAADLTRAFEQVACAYQHRLYAFALRLCGRPEEAEEIAQDALVRAYRALATYAPERIRALQLRAWLFQIALNVARNRVRRRGPEVTSLDAAVEGAGWEPDANPDERPDALAVRAEQSRELAARLLALPERFRAAVILRHVEGLSYCDIAVALSQPVGTVKANVHRGVLLLRAALVEQLSEAR